MNKTTPLTTTILRMIVERERITPARYVLMGTEAYMRVCTEYDQVVVVLGEHPTRSRRERVAHVMIMHVTNVAPDFVEVV